MLHIITINYFSVSSPLAKSSRKLTFLYLANDVIQNSKKKGPEFTRDFEGVLVDACSHVARWVYNTLLLSKAVTLIKMVIIV